MLRSVKNGARPYDLTARILFMEAHLTAGKWFATAAEDLPELRQVWPDLLRELGAD